MMCVEVVVVLEAARSLEFSVWGGQPRDCKVKCVMVLFTNAVITLLIKVIIVIALVLLRLRGLLLLWLLPLLLLLPCINTIILIHSVTNFYIIITSIFNSLKIPGVQAV